MSDPIRIKPTQQEVDLQQRVEWEFYQTRLPQIHLFKRSRVVHENLGVDLGDIVAPHPIVLHANWDTDRKRKEIRNGFYIETQRIEVRFFIPELEEKQVTLEKGDIIDLSPESDTDDMYELLEIEREGRIRMHHNRLFRFAVIDLESRWSP